MTKLDLIFSSNKKSQMVIFFKEKMDNHIENALIDPNFLYPQLDGGLF